MPVGVIYNQLLKTKSRKFTRRLINNNYLNDRWTNFILLLGGIACLLVCLQQGIKIKQTALENQWGLNAWFLGCEDWITLSDFPGESVRVCHQTSEGVFQSLSHSHFLTLLDCSWSSCLSPHTYVFICVRRSQIPTKAILLAYASVCSGWLLLSSESF